METIEEIIELTEINEICDYLVTCDYPYYEELRECFLLLLVTGCRVRELFEIERWSHVSEDIYTVQPQKGNELRTIELDNRFVDFKSAIAGQYKPFLGRTLSQLDNLFNNIKKWNFFRTGTKMFSTYIFRYRYVKYESSSGMSLSEIAADMGYCCVSTPTAYLEAVIYKNFKVVPLPTVKLGDQEWMTRVLSINDNLGGIYYPNGNADNVADYGLLYSRTAALRVAQGFPEFRVPSSADFATLMNFLVDSVGAQLAGFQSAWLDGVVKSSPLFNASGISIPPAGVFMMNLRFLYINQGYYMVMSDIGSNNREVYRYCFRNNVNLQSTLANEGSGGSLLLIKNS